MRGQVLHRREGLLGGGPVAAAESGDGGQAGAVGGGRYGAGHGDAEAGAGFEGGLLDGGGLAGPLLVGTQAHPGLRSRPARPNPLFAALARAAADRAPLTVT
ncbi:hypothetical protein ACFY71_13650 [Streptomyces cinerochromogenes]|uniref:hypothetical protein n=1 Tax=Streptomyces cinerochromogenes TaxID=66422 RepID=UPI0036B39910